MNFFPTISTDINLMIINYLPDQELIKLASTCTTLYALCTSERFWKLRFSTWLTSDYFSAKLDNLTIAQWYRFWRQQSFSGTVTEIADKLQLSYLENYNRLRTVQGHINESSINYRNICRLLEWAITSSYDYFDQTSIRFMFSLLDDNNFIRYLQGAIDNYRVEYAKIALSLNRSLLRPLRIYTDTTSTVKGLLQNVAHTILLHNTDIDHHRNMLHFRCCLFEMFKRLIIDNLWDDAEELFNYDRAKRTEYYKAALYATGHFELAQSRFSEFTLSEIRYFLSISHYDTESAFSYYKQHKQTIINSLESVGFIPVLADTVQQIAEYEACSIPYTVTNKFYRNNETNLEYLVRTYTRLDNLIDDKYIVYSPFVYKLFDLLIKYHPKNRIAVLAIAQSNDLLDVIEWLKIN